MANIDNSVIIMHQKLKQLFPDISDNVIYNCARMFPHDIQRCIELLGRQSTRCAFFAASNPAHTYPNKNMPVYNVENPQMPPYVQGRFSEIPQTFLGNNAQGRINGVSSLRSQNTGVARQAEPTYGHGGNVRSYSVTGATAPQTKTSEFHSTVEASVQQPQSAPVMPTHYEPFRVEYHGQAEMKIGPSLGQLHIKVPENFRRYPVNDDTYFDQHGIPVSPEKYKYEMHMRYKAYIRDQQSLKERLRLKLGGEKQKLDELRADVIAMEKELELRRCQKRVQNSLVPYAEIKKLREETTRLRVECDNMSKQVDQLVKGEVPLGETSLDFYTNINPGQLGSVGVPPKRPEHGSSSLSHQSSMQPPPALTNQENDDDDKQWSCSTCTFLNNGALDKCEMCEMARFPLARGFT